jgi:UDP-N-acetylglucosamine 1-carboxyvinyltransferase
LIGALARREKEYLLYRTGGCKLGERTVRPHLYALNKLGVEVETGVGFYKIKNGKLRGTHIVMYESGDTATANAILAAAQSPGVTTIAFASANYMVQSLCYFLVEAGAKIEGIGTTNLKITGVDSLHGVKSFTLMPDPVDAMAWIALAVTTKSKLIIEDCPLDFLELELEKLRVMGQKLEINSEHLAKSGKFRLVDITLTPSKLTALPDKIYGRPFPGLNIDCLPLFVPILTQAKGRTLVHDWVYENRAIYYLDFQKLGSKIVLLDPHRVFVEGPSKLKGNELICPPAIRPAMALLIAACAATGTTILRNVSPIERAYEELIPRLRAVGVQIEKVQ